MGRRYGQRTRDPDHGSNKAAISFARLVSAQLRDSSLKTTFLPKLEVEKGHWPKELQDLLEKELSGLDLPCTSSAVAVPAQDAPSVQQTTSKPQEQPIANKPLIQTAQGSGTELPECLLLFRKRIDQTKQDLLIFNALDSLIVNLIAERQSGVRELAAAEQGRQELEAKLQSIRSGYEHEQELANAEVSRLRSEVAKADADIRAAAARHEDERRETTSESDRLRSEIERARLRFAEDKRLLAQQISVNASGRVDEFRKRIGGALSRLAVDLPNKDVEMSSDLGRAVLLLFHQFVDALQEQGIPVTTRNNVQ